LRCHALQLALAMDPDLAEAYDLRGCEKLLAGEPSAGADFSKLSSFDLTTL